MGKQKASVRATQKVNKKRNTNKRECISLNNINGNMKGERLNFTAHTRSRRVPTNNNRNENWLPCYYNQPVIRSIGPKEWKRFHKSTFPKTVLGVLGWSLQAPGGTLRGTFNPKPKLYEQKWNTNKHVWQSYRP